MAARLLAAGWRMAPSPQRAEIVIVNTCAFIEDAKKESLAAVFEACAWKQKGFCRAVVVAGCLPQRYRRELPASMPEVDAWIGLDAIERVGEILGRVLGGEKGIAAIPPSARAVIEPPLDRLPFTGGPFAYLKIAEGCHHHCRFCAIPRIRGRYRSRPMNTIRAEAEHLLARGIRELDLISQDVTSYGRDLGSGADLPGLLRELGAIGGRFWIRLLYGHPAHVSDALLQAMGEVPQVCHYLDIPIQHSHPDMLKAMGRPPVPGGLAELVRHIRRVLPAVTLRTTCLVGFPGENRLHFQDLLQFVEASRFERLGAFVFSREEGTPAAGLPGQVPRRVAERRRARLMCVQQAIVFQHAAARVGRTGEILIDKKAPRKQDTWIGRSRGEAPEVDGVVFLKTGRAEAGPGQWLTARYTAAAGYDMRAVPADE